MLKSYSAHLEKNPLLTKCITCATTNGLGQLLVQKINQLKGSQKEGAVDLKKVGKFALYGMLAAAPLDHGLYLLLGKLLRPLERRPMLHGVLKLLLANALILPVQNLAFLLSLYLINVRDNIRIKEWIGFARRRFLSVQVPTWTFFPPIQIFAFKCLPADFVSPFFYSVGFAFNVAVALTQAPNKEEDEYKKRD